LAKTQLIYSVSCFNLWGFGALFGGLSPQKFPVATGLGECCKWLNVRSSE